MYRLLLALLLLCAALARAAEPDLLEPDKAFRFSARLKDARSIEVTYEIAPGYYLYREQFKFSVTPPDAKLGAPQLPPGKMKNDEFFGEVETYRGNLSIVLPLELAEPKPCSRHAERRLAGLRRRGRVLRPPRAEGAAAARRRGRSAQWARSPQPFPAQERAAARRRRRACRRRFRRRLLADRRQLLRVRPAPRRSRRACSRWCRYSPGSSSGGGRHVTRTRGLPARRDLRARHGAHLCRRGRGRGIVRRDALRGAAEPVGARRVRRAVRRCSRWRCSASTTCSCRWRCKAGSRPRATACTADTPPASS